MANVEIMQTDPYILANNDTDWLHQTFLDCFQQHQRIEDVDGVQREHTLYGPQGTRLSWIYPPSHRFLVKPQALLMPEVFLDDNDEADTSFSSTQAVDGDTSMDSMGGRVVSHWRDVFVQKNRREVDFIVAKKLLNGGRQLPFLVVELKRDDLDMAAAMKQIDDYLKRVVSRCRNFNYNVEVYGLLVLGRVSLRMVAGWNPVFKRVDVRYPDEVGNKHHYLDTDSVDINRWLLGQAAAWLDV